MISDIVYYQKHGRLYIDEDGVPYESKFGNPHGKFKHGSPSSRPRKRRRKSEPAPKSTPPPPEPAFILRKPHSRYSFRRMVIASPQSKKLGETQPNVDPNSQPDIDSADKSKITQTEVAKPVGTREGNAEPATNPSSTRVTTSSSMPEGNLGKPLSAIVSNQAALAADVQTTGNSMSLAAVAAPSAGAGASGS